MIDYEYVFQAPVRDPKTKINPHLYIINKYMFHLTNHEIHWAKSICLWSRGYAVDKVGHSLDEMVRKNLSLSHSASEFILLFFLPACRTS